MFVEQQMPSCLQLGTNNKAPSVVTLATDDFRDDFAPWQPERALLSGIEFSTV